MSEFKQEIKASFEEHFTDDPHRAVESEEQEIHLADENKLDLTPFIREALLLQFPYIPVCREDCKGCVRNAEKTGIPNRAVPG